MLGTRTKFCEEMDIFCSKDENDQLSAIKSYIIGDLGWLYEENKFGSSSVCNYLSAVTIAHTRTGRPRALTPLVQLVMYAFQQ